MSIPSDPPAVSPRPLSRRAVEWIEKAALWPGAPVVATFLVAIAGLLGGLWATEIRTAFPIRLFQSVGDKTVFIPFCGFDPDWECDWLRNPALFWTFAFLGSLIFGVREWAKARDDERNRERLNEEIQTRTRNLAEQALDLHERARTLPPEDFLQSALDLQSTMHEIHRMSHLSSGTETQEALQGEALAALAACLELARRFERPDRRYGRWAANVMAFAPITALSDQDLIRYQKMCPYSMLSFERADLAGVLLVRPELSIAVAYASDASSDAPPRVDIPDPQLRPIALPVPAKPVTPSHQRLQMLPGAPYALYGNLPTGYPNTWEMGRKAEVDCDLPPGTAEQMRQYFSPKESPQIRSLISLPLLHTTATEEAGWTWTPPDSPEHTQTLLSPHALPQGVLNIHRDREYMACTDERILLFYPVLVPVVAVLRDLIILMDEAEARAESEPGAILAGTNDHPA